VRLKWRTQWIVAELTGNSGGDCVNDLVDFFREALFDLRDHRIPTDKAIRRELR
jgi:hypothetical protein